MKKIKVSLSTDSISAAIKELQGYKKDLRDKCSLLVSKLIDSGIKTAKANAGEYGDLIIFSKELDPAEYGCKGIMVAKDGQKIISEWKYKGGTKKVEVSPLLMAEFGSGWKAKVLDEVEGVGQGTFPEQTHAFDPNGWWWTDTDGKTHHSTGEAPTYPMHAASVAMLMEINRIAREVFGGSMVFGD